MNAAAVSSIRSEPATARSARPRRPRPAFAAGLAERLLLEFVTAEDVRSGMTRAVAMLRREGGAARVEWWAPTEDGTAVRLEAVEGGALGRRVVVPLGAAGVVVLTGNRCGSQLIPAVRRLAPVLGRRFVEERLAGRAARLARRNEALEDYRGARGARVEGAAAGGLSAGGRAGRGGVRARHRRRAARARPDRRRRRWIRVSDRVSGLRAPRSRTAFRGDRLGSAGRVPDATGRAASRVA